MYDPRVARFKSNDPLTAKFPYCTPYQFAGNTLIQAIDLDGAEEFHYTRIKGNDGNSTLQLIGKNNIVDNVLVGYRAGRSMGNDAGVPVYEQRTNARQVYTVHDNWREPVDRNGGMSGQDWKDFDVRTFYKSYIDAVAGKNGGISKSDMAAMRMTQYGAAVKVDNAGLPALGAGNLRSEVAAVRALTAVEEAEASIVNKVPNGSNANHIFSGKAGKFMDNAANRSMIEKLSNNKANYQGVDEYGKSWYSETQANGTQNYSYTKDGIIKGAGFNETPVDLKAAKGLK